MTKSNSRVVARRDIVFGLAGTALASASWSQVPPAPPVPPAPAAPPPPLPAPPPPKIATRRLNNVMIAVSDMNRSVAFYQRLFGPAVMQDQSAIFRLGDGPHFFALTPVAAGAKPEFVSFGMTVGDFDANRLVRTLADFRVPGAQVVMRGDTPELFVPDPSGIKIQLQDVAYGRGSGPRGEVLAPAGPATVTPAFRLKSISHVTLTVKDGTRSKEFYQTVFGMPIQTMQGAGAILAVGSGPDCVVVPAGANPNAAGGINHACFTIENFDAGRVMGILIANGLEPIEYGNPALIKPLTCRVRLRQKANNGGGPTAPLGTPELYFNDPDNIPIQLQDVSYCGGSGALGQICP